MILLTAQEITALVERLARQIRERSPRAVLVPLLDGALPFAADLLRQLPPETGFAPMRVKAGRATWMPEDHELRTGHLWVLDVVVDSGASLQAAVSFLQRRAPGRVFSAALLCAPSATIRPTLVGLMRAPTGRALGYGEDVHGVGRGLPDLHESRGTTS